MVNLETIYNGKDLRDLLNISPKQFNQKSEKIKLLFNLDLDDYRIDPDDNSSNFQFNYYEIQLLSIIFNAIEHFPYKITEINFSDDVARNKAKTERPEAFMKYIEAVTINIDSVDDSDLKSHIYASISYDRTSEYLSARQKLQDSLSNFIQYTNSLSFTESSKKQRELAYRIDEMLFELIQDNENKIDDIDKLIGNSTNKTILQSNPLDLKNFHRRFEYYQKDEFLHSEEYINAEDEMLDIYIIELLNDMRNKRESVKKEIISKYKNNSQDAADVQSKKQEELALWNVMDPVSQEIQMNKHKNMEKIYSVIEYYKNSNYRKMDYIKKLEIIKDNYLELEQNSYFHSYLYEFYKGLIKLNTSMDWNRDNFIQSGVAPEMINHIIYDLKRIYLIIDKYNISGQIEQIAQKNDNFLIAKQEFEKIKETYINNEYVNTNTNKLTSWSFAERMNKILKDIN